MFIFSNTLKNCFELCSVLDYAPLVYCVKAVLYVLSFSQFHLILVFLCWKCFPFLCVFSARLLFFIWAWKWMTETQHGKRCVSFDMDSSKAQIFILNFPAAMKLDFKSLDSVGLSLDVLNQKNQSRGINRPVWINADILLGPNTPSFVPPINGTR